MDKELIRAKCDRVLVDKQPVFTSILNNRIQKIYKKHESTLGSQIDYMLLTDFMSNVLTAFSGVISEIMIQTIQEVLSDDILDNDDESD